MSFESHDPLHHPERRRPNIWAGQSTIFGHNAHSYYVLSNDADSVDYYVSHTPEDDGGKKVSLLRDFPCLHHLLGCVFKSDGDAHRVTLGFGISSFRNSFPLYVPRIPLVLVSIGILVWQGLARYSLVPFTWIPWAFPPCLLWVQQCCVDQSSPQSIEAAIRSIPDFLSESGRFTAFVSDAYFKELVCVLELAPFCRHCSRSNYEERILLLSTRWPHALNPLRQAGTTAKEGSWHKGFTLAEAGCAKPSDRAYILERIRHYWESEEVFMECLDLMFGD